MNEMTSFVFIVVYRDRSSWSFCQATSYSYSLLRLYYGFAPFRVMKLKENL